MSGIAAELTAPLVELLLSLADDKFLLGHRNADWTGLGPILEEDIAFSSLAQDELAHAAALYDLVAVLRGGDQNQLAFGRTAAEYRCAAIVELPDEFDWAVALTRQFFCDHFDALRLERLSGSSYRPLAELTRRILAEERVHVEHADAWVLRLGRGGAEARARMQKAFDLLAPQAPGLFEATEGLATLETAGVYPPLATDMFALWRDALLRTAGEAGLRLTLAAPAAHPRGGRRGVHSARFAALLDEMCEVYRIEPNAAW